MKLFTEIRPEKDPTFEVGLEDRLTLLGSCFSDNIAARLSDGGFTLCRNPFGTLYNPASIAAAASRLDSGEPFIESDCVQMGAGSPLVCSFSHHTSFARPTAGEFLANANARLAEASKFWKESNVAVLTLGTAFVWRVLSRGGEVAANCLKRPSAEFSRELLSAGQCESLIEGIVERHPDKRFILTVSPIRHLSDGAHANTVSKSTLHLAVDSVLRRHGNVRYFPAFEILLDELRDYRFYDRDLVHPRDIAVDILWERFLEAFVPDKDKAGVRANEKSAARSRHKPILV